jgi:hypothetical protein
MKSPWLREQRIDHNRRQGYFLNFWSSAGDHAMDRRKACLAQVKMCRERAAADPGRREFWLAEAAKWQRRANEEVHIAYQIGDGELAQRSSRLRWYTVSQRFEAAVSPRAGLRSISRPAQHPTSRGHVQRSSSTRLPKGAEAMQPRSTARASMRHIPQPWW